MYYTGNSACDALNDLHIQGNVVPRSWFSTIVKKDLKHPKPHLLAINILSDIVYWYRPVEVRDEVTGELRGLKKKFRGTLLQRSYKAIADMYGCSKDTAKEAVVFLETLGVIHRVFEDISVGEIAVNNVMYLDLDVNKLRELTYPMEISMEGGENFHEPGVELSTHLSPESPRTNTENTQDISTKTSVSITPSVHNAARAVLTEEELIDEIDCELAEHNTIPYHYQNSKEKMTIAVRLASDWYNHRREHFDSDLSFEAYRLLVDCLIDMACSNEAHTYNKTVVPNGKFVIERINRCLSEDGDLHHFIGETIDDYTTGASSSKIRNVTAYMQSVIWGSFASYRAKFESQFAASAYAYS